MTRTDLKPCPFCGGEANVKMWCEPDTPYLVMCESCKASVNDYATEAEAIEAWNKRAETTVETLMRVFAYDATCGVCDKRKERTAKAIEHDASVTDTDGYKYHRSEYLCGACKKKVLGGDEYCSHCGVKLDWGE